MKTITRNITLQELSLSCSSEMLSSVGEISGNAFATLKVLNNLISTAHSLDSIHPEDLHVALEFLHTLAALSHDSNELENGSTAIAKIHKGNA